MADLKNLSVEEFAAVTGSDAPAPGGGSVAALAGGLGAALAEMVANLTIGKAKYADVEEEMKGLAAEGAALRKELIDSIQKDTESFTAYMNALGMPKNTDEEKAARKEAMQNGLKAQRCLWQLQKRPLRSSMWLGLWWSEATPTPLQTVWWLP